MSHAALGPAVNKDGEARARPFVKCLLRLIRAQDFHGNRTPGCWPISLSPRNCAGISTQWQSGSVLDRSGAGDRGALRRDDIVNNRNQTSVETSTGSASRLSGNSRRPAAKLVGDVTAAIAYPEVARA